MTSALGPGKGGSAFALDEGEPFAGRYRLEHEAGVGGMGVVYRALDLTSGEVVALKVLRKADEASARRFAAEAGALERLRHPAVVRYVAHGVSGEGEPFLAMQWLEGESLRARLGREQRLAIGEAIALGRRLCGALGALHEAGLVHRDVKPSNIMLAGGAVEAVTLVDFGIARAVDDSYMTTTGLFVGTPGYVAPEQAQGLREVDGRADLFSLGCVLFRCLTGREPFDGPNTVTVLAKLILHEAPRVSEFRAGVPPALEGLVARLLAKDPEQRPPSAGLLEAEFAKAADELVGLSVRPFSLGGGAWGFEGTTGGGQAITKPPGGPAGRASSRSLRQGAPWFGPVALLASVALAALAGRGPQERAPGLNASAPSPRTPTTSASAAPVPTAISALAASPACAPEAVASYRQGLRMMRQASWEQARTFFTKAAEADPSCPEALLRLFQVDGGRSDFVEAHSHMTGAFTLRDALSERDRLLLDALVSLAESDAPAAERAIEEGLRRHPGDAELVAFAASRKRQTASRPDELEAALGLAREATRLDPEYADAWQAQARLLWRLGRPDEGLEAARRCVQVAPGAVDCVHDRIAFLHQHGRCDEAVEEARLGLKWAPGSATLYRDLATLLAAQGAPREATEGALRMRWGRLQPDVLEHNRLGDLAEIAAWYGDFEGALRWADGLERSVRNRASSEQHFHAARLAVEALFEAGQDAEAVRRLGLVVGRMATWDRRETPVTPREPEVLGLALAAGQIQPSAFREATERWGRRAETTFSAVERWAARWGSAVGPRLDPADVAQGEPPRPDHPLSSAFWIWQAGYFEAYEGRLRLHAHDAVRALPLLESAARSCQGLDYPFLNVRAHLWLGKAKEGLGDKAGACTAYGVVLKRWGKAKPRSITADEARRRRQALNCSS